MKTYDVVIIGAGAAGLMCAAQAGQRERSVCILDHANKAGKKILMSGGGRCNFTNLTVTDQHFISHNQKFCKSALMRYRPDDFITLVKKHNIPYHEKTLGQLFCDNKSKDILNMLLDECSKAHAELMLNTNVHSITQKPDNGFVIDTSRGQYACTSLVIATGGLSIPTMGASPFGYQVAKQFGIDVRPTRAALVPFTLHAKDKDKYDTLSGISVECVVSCNKKYFREKMLFTHRGLSGPAMLQISSYWLPGDTLNIRLLPDIDLLGHLKETRQRTPNARLKSVLQAFLPKRLIGVFLTPEEEGTTLQEYSHKQLQAIADTFQAWNIKPCGTEGYRTAEVTMGGVDCNAVSSKTFEAKNTPGLYFIGEVLDVTGWLGGYNFQWAWASGFAAGTVC